MRITGQYKQPVGAFYVPVGHHLRIQIAEEDIGGGWWSIGQCGDKACQNSPASLWFTTADAYSLTNSGQTEGLLKVQLNANHAGNWEDIDISYDIIAFQGVNSNIQIKYGDIDRTVRVPLYKNE